MCSVDDERTQTGFISVYPWGTLASLFLCLSIMFPLHLHAEELPDTGQVSTLAAADESQEADTKKKISPSSHGDQGNVLIAPNVDLKEVVEEESPPTVTPTPEAESQAKVEPASDNKAHKKGNFVILGAEVEPGTATRLAWRPDVGIAGLSTPTPVLVVNGSYPGDTLCLTAAIHGDELNGIEIVRRVLYDLKPEKLRGIVIGIPIVNLQGFHRGSRYLPDRRDLNRYFPGSPDGSLASRIAFSFFNEVIFHCDSLIDLHTGSLRRTNLPQLRADMRHPDVMAFTEDFDDTVVLHSRGGKGMLRTAAVQHGIPALTLEVGESLRLQEKQVETGVRIIKKLLYRKEMYNSLFSWGDPEPVYYKSRWLRATRGGILFSNVKLGEKIKNGDVLGTVTDPITNQQSEIVSPYAGRILGMAVNQVVMPGFAAYHVGIEAPEKSLAEPSGSEEIIEMPEEYLDEEREPED
ncbi:MAG TPA: succinylglutamate desuccinylase [Gammaproteobacteria bacterium]|nr:succinylglutamate desuccinylase [Gammaproteobacteria bacterium]